MTDTQKLRLVQLALFLNSDYNGNTNGVLTDSDRDEAKVVIQSGVYDDHADGENANMIILALMAAGFNDNLDDDGVPGEQFEIGLRKAFGIPEPEPEQAAAQD